jgi:hypothetical protein
MRGDTVTSPRIRPRAKQIEERILSLGPLLDAERTRRRLSLREAADEMGLGFTTLARLENGKLPDMVNTFVIVDWLGLPLHWLALDEPDAIVAAYERGWADCAASVAVATKRWVTP